MAAIPTQVFPVIWQGDRVLLINQTRLPREYSFVEVSRYDDMADAIRLNIVRGAIAIGLAAAYGLYLGARDLKTTDRDQFFIELSAIAEKLRAVCPPAVYLAWAIDRMLKTARQTVGTVEHLQKNLLHTAQVIHLENLKTCQAIGEYGLTALPPTPAQLRILTHCNAGALATAGYGTALGVIRSAWGSGRLARVYANETRPRWQGSKLTTWECLQEGIPVTVIADHAAAYCMQQGMIDAVVVGAERIAANGDTINRIGTYGLALVAKAHNIPFLVATPTSSIDYRLSMGVHFDIAERSPTDLTRVDERWLCPPGVDAYNPASDVTPAELITGIVTEHGILNPHELSQCKDLQEAWAE